MIYYQTLLAAPFVGFPNNYPITHPYSGGHGPAIQLPVFGAGVVAFKGGRSQKFCTDDPNSNMICNRDTVGPWEKFKVASLGNNQYTLTSGRTSQLCSDNVEVSECNRSAVGPWETFTIIPISSNTVSIKGGNQGKYCSDDSTFICNRDTVGPWETFTWQFV